MGMVEMTELEVLSPGMYTTAQDAGRFGYLDKGVPPAGPMDFFAFSLANALVGNLSGTTCLELTIVGGLYRVRGGSCRISVTGDFPLWLNGKPIQAWRSIVLTESDEIKIGQAGAGCRGYLAIAGGMALEPQLGSCSTLARANLGGLDGGPLRRGQRVALNFLNAPDSPGFALSADHAPEILPWYLPGPVRVVVGPEYDAFSELDLHRFFQCPYRVTSDADRMGYRLSGSLISHLGGYDMISEPISAGAIQIPGDGQPIIALCDRQTTGGYPKIATVIRHDLARLGQCRPGQALRFSAVSVEHAEALWRDSLGMLNTVIQKFDTFDPKEDPHVSTI